MKEKVVTKEYLSEKDALEYVDGLATVGEVYLVTSLNNLTPKERERVADCLSGIAADILKGEAKNKVYLMSIYQTEEDIHVLW